MISKLFSFFLSPNLLQLSVPQWIYLGIQGVCVWWWWWGTIFLRVVVGIKGAHTEKVLKTAAAQYQHCKCYRQTFLTGICPFTL